MSGSAGNTSDWLLSAMKKNPEGLLLLAAGAVLLMRKTGGLGLSNAMSSGLSQNGGFTKAAAGAKEYVAGAKEYAAGAKDYAADVAERAKQTVGSAASSASEYADQARRTVSRQSERVMDQAQSTFQSTMNRVLQDQPLMVALAGMAAGAAVAAAFPTTDFEKETLGPLGEQVSDAANRMGEQFKEATAKAGEKLKNVVDEKGLNVGGLKDVASEVAGAFSGSLTGGSGSGTSDKAPQTKLPGEHGYRG
jgi:hypothetical protein